MFEESALLYIFFPAKTAGVSSFFLRAPPDVHPCALHLGAAKWLVMPIKMLRMRSPVGKENFRGVKGGGHVRRNPSFTSVKGGFFLYRFLVCE